MPYDELGNFYGSDEDLGALEAKYTKPDLASQIPGQVSTSKSDEPKSLREKAVAALTQANPLMMAKSFQDMTKTLVGGAALPVVAPVSAGVQALNALPGNMLRRSRGEEEIRTPSAEDLMRKYGEAIAPQTPAGQNFQEGVGKLMETLKVPHAWPVTPNVPRRPLVTPTDVRVGAGQVKQLAKELRETPADFQAAQSGLKRQNLYGEDTLGVKAQAAADALGDTLERRKSAGLSTIPGVPQALTPETKLYAVRPKGSRLVQPKVPESAKGYVPEFNALNDIVADIYGDTPAAQMPPEMIMAEYAKRYLPPDSEIRGVITNYGKLKAQEMFPDAPTPGDAQRAYDVLYSNRTERNKQQLADVEEFLNLPENAAYRETMPTPSEFMQRMGEAERVIKGPFTTYLSKNVGAEGDPTVKLARQGITVETPEAIKEVASFASPVELAKKRTEAGFPAMGSFYEERMAKTGELDRLNAEIEALEDARRPLFNRAHDEGIDPASIPEYAETTNPLRQKLRQAEQIKGELENIKLASMVEDVSDFAVAPKTKQELISKIPFTEQQFFPSVTKAGEGEKLYTGRKSIISELGFEKLGKELVEDILTGKAGDTSKLTIENYMREKGLSRIEAEKAAKLQAQQYRVTLQNTLLDRLKNDQNVQTFGNAAIITLDKNTPKDVAMRDMSADTAVLDHCVGQCGTAPQGRKNILTGNQQYYEPVIDPITGERHARGGTNTSYVNELERGSELVSVRDVKTGLPAATIQLNPTSMSRELSDGTFNIGYASGAKNGAVAPEYVDAIKDYLNSRASSIKNSGPNLIDNTGIFDTTAPGEWRRVTKEAGLTKDQATAFEAEMDIPRFVTVKDIKEMSKEYLTLEQPSQSRSLAVADNNRMPDMSADDLLIAHRDRLTPEQQGWLDDFIDRYDTQVDDTGPGQARGDQLDREYRQWAAQNRLQPDPLANLFDNVGDWEPEPGAVANAPDVFTLARRYDIPPVTVQEIQARFRDPEITVADLSMLRDSARAGAPRTVFENLPEESRDGAANMITEEIQRRREQAPAQPAAQLAPREPVPREIQVMATQDLAQDMTPAWNRQAQELADTYFNDNVIDGNDVTISALTNMIRNYRAGPHANAPYEVRELAARRLEGMHTEAMQNAEQLADSLNEAFYADMDPEEAVDQITRDIRMIRENGENAWEDLVGPMAEDFPWNRNVQQHLIEYLQEIANNYGNQREQGYAKGGMVKKKRKAKKPTMALVVTRKNPGLAEMAYRYGGMVR